MKNLIISSLALLAMINCSSDDTTEENPVVDPTTIVPTKFTEITQDNQTYVIEYKYDGTKLLEALDTGENEKTVYTYDGDNIVKTEDYDGTMLVYMREFTYANGKVVSEKVTNKHQGTLIYTKTYEYVSDNHVRYNGDPSYVYNPITNTFSFLQYPQVDVYITNNKNLLSVKSTDGAQTTNYTYQYDAQNSPFKNVKGLLKIEFLNLDGEAGTNNLTKYSEIRTGTVPGTAGSTGVHTYNDYNFPTKSLMTYTSSTFPTNTHTYLYEYNH